MAAAWDKRSAKEQAGVADRGVRSQFVSAVGPFSPYWRARLRELGIKASSVDSMAKLRRLPAIGERDVCPGGDPAGAARLVLQIDEAGWALHASGPELRGGLASRLRRKPSYKQSVEAATRPTVYTFGGVGLLLPLASTRTDLDLIARAGARLWTVLGLTSADVLVSALPIEQRLGHVGLSYAAVGAGAPALFPGDDPLAVTETLRIVPATVLAVPAEDAGAIVDELLATGGGIPDTVRTVLLVGGPSAAERRDVVEQLPGRRVLGVWGPPDGRVLYGESRAGEGYVTYPDLEVLDVVDPDTGDPVGAREGGELVVTQLGFRGSALVRWRTGTLLEAPIAVGQGTDGRTVPRLPSDLVPDGLVPIISVGGRVRPVDLRAVSGALAGRRDLAAFRVDLEPDGSGVDADGRPGMSLVISLAVARGNNEDFVADEVVKAVRAASGVRPDEVLIDPGLLG